jgi:hypothetical protein
VLAALLWALPLLAAAQPAGSLRWRAPSGCPSHAEIARMLPPEAEALELDGEIVQEGRGYRLRLSARGGGHRFERTLRAETCDVLGESAVWLVQLASTQLSAAGDLDAPGAGARDVPAADPDSRAAAQGSAAADSARGQDDAAQDGSPAGPSEVEYLSTGAPAITHDAAATSAAESGDDSDRAGLRCQLGLGAAATELGLSGLTPHLALDVMLALADWSFGVRLGMLLHPKLRVSDGASVDLSTSAAQLLGCRLWDTGRLRLGPCGSLNALHTSARTTGLRGGEESSATWLTAGAALVLYVRVARAVLLGAELGGWAALTARPSFEVAGTTLAQAGTLSGYARLAVLYEIR